MSMLTREAATRHALKSGVAPSSIIAVQAATTQLAGRDLTFMLLPTPPTDPRDLEIWQHLSIVRNGTDDNLPSVADALATNIPPDRLALLRQEGILDDDGNFDPTHPACQTFARAFDHAEQAFDSACEDLVRRQSSAQAMADALIAEEEEEHNRAERRADKNKRKKAKAKAKAKAAGSNPDTSPATSSSSSSRATPATSSSSASSSSRATPSIPAPSPLLSPDDECLSALQSLGFKPIDPDDEHADQPKEAIDLVARALSALELAGAASTATVPPSFVCPITHELMVDPVSTVDGQVYERQAIEAWLKTNDTSPITNEPLPLKLLIPNHPLRAMIAEFVERCHAN
jgi:hypothetical protein